MQDSQQQCSLCDSPATVWVSFVDVGGAVRQVGLCAAHAKVCGWLEPKSWDLVGGWKLAPQQMPAGGAADELLQSALSAMADNVAELTGGHFKSITVQLQKIGAEGKPVPLRSVIGKSCPDCGFTAADWRETGRLGCSSCYRTFGSAISRQLPGLHGGANVNWGKIPEGKQPALVAARLQRIERLKAQLTAAVDNENYEQASLLRDRICDLQAHLP